MTRRSDALTALVAEVADLDRDIAARREREDDARREFVAARQALDTAAAAVSAAEKRRVATTSALDLIASRDDVSDETVAALLERAAR